MSSMADLRPGDIGFGPLYGGWGKLAMWGEVIVDGGFRVGDLNVGHVFVVTEVDSSESLSPAEAASALIPDLNWVTTRDDRSLPLPHVVEAMPNGAREVTIGQERWTDRYAYVRLPEDYPGQGEDAAAIARAMIGTPYSPLSYAALAAWRLDMLKGKQLPDGTIEPSKLETWIDRRADPVVVNGTALALPKEAICSVLADQSWALTGKQVMPAGTPHQCVTPSGLGAALLAMPGAAWFWPGH